MKGKFLNGISNSMKHFAGKTGAKISKRSPELLMVAGGISFVVTIVVACKQTLKCEEVLDEHKKVMDDIEESLELAANEEAENKVEYTEEDAKRDKFVAYCHTAYGFGKIYLPVLFLIILTLMFFGCGFNKLKKRNIAITAAYKALDSTFRKYRGRVRDELGEESDEHFLYGFQHVREALVAGKDADGNTVAATERDIDVVPWDEDGVPGMTFIFAPETSKYYFPDEIHNDASINAARSNMQVDFDIYGFLFLNDVLDALGLQKVPYGQLVGWKKGIGDPYIDFRTRKFYRKASTDPNRNPLGLDYETIYEFDFNHCGLIWDKI